MPIFRKPKREPKDRSQEVLDAVKEFVSAPTMVETRRILEAKQDILLSDAAASILDKLIDDFADEEHIALIMQDHRELLDRCREQGIERGLHSAERGYVRPSETEHSAGQTADTFEIYNRGLRSIQEGRIEEAIKLLNQALGQTTSTSDPVLWPSIHHNLGEAYRRRERGSQAENLEKAIQHFKEALSVRSFRNCPEPWARTNNSVGAAYAERVRGDRMQNIEHAIHFFEEALQVYSPEEHPAQWANLQNNLGHIYLDRIAGKPSENSLTALRYFSGFSKICSREDYPGRWAAINAHLKARGL